jgi:hypothetical protein
MTNASRSASVELVIPPTHSLNLLSTGVDADGLR